MIIFGFYLIFGLGVILYVVPIIKFVVMFMFQEFSTYKTIKSAFYLIIGIIILRITLPSLTYIINKDFEVLQDECTIEIVVKTGGRGGDTTDITFHMLETGDEYYFSVIPELEDHDETKHYYCAVTVTKDHMWEIGYEVYDIKSRELLTQYMDE
jgi:hypothetical protein